MRVVGLISGGKDSIYNMLQCIAAGHEIVAVANVEPYVKKDEIDSYMYQTVGHEMLSLISGALGLPIYRQKTKGYAICKDKNYVETREDEVEDLFFLLNRVKDEAHVEGVSIGAIASDYQRTRAENVCMRLNLKCFAYLWKRDQEELLQEMIDCDVNAIIIKVACLGLKPNVHLGMSIKDIQPILLDLHKRFGVNVCGEGGEYETLAIDCPLYHRQINILKSEKVLHSDDAHAQVGFLSIKNAELEAKHWEKQSPLPTPEARSTRIKNVVRPPMYYIRDCMDAISTRIFEESRYKNKGAAPEVLPFPFAASHSHSNDEGSKTLLSDSWRASNQSASAPHFIVPMNQSLMPNIDTSVFQLNHSTGWCCIGNVSAPGIKEGLGFVRKHLERYQYEMRNIVSVSLFVRDMADWPKINKIYAQILPNFCPPTRSFASVPLPADVNVIITVVAHRLVSKAQRLVHHTHNTVDKDVIHVQSISHWAPANIGPYSQAVRIGEIVYVCGQIPLVPGTLELLIAPVLQQCRLSLRHIFRILRAVNEDYSMSNVMCGICYVVSEEVAAEVNGLWSYLTKNEHAAIGIVVVTGLPKNAQLEWHVLASGYQRPQVNTATETVDTDFEVRWKRCLFAQQHTAVAIFHVGYSKRPGRKERNPRPIPLTADNLMNVMRCCLHYLRDDIPSSGAPLSRFNAFYKANNPNLASVLGDFMKSSNHHLKVVVTCIPVVALEEPDIFLTISGVCH